jgi:hypothetical protein
MPPYAGDPSMSMSFMDEYVAGTISADAIDEYVDRWQRVRLVGEAEELSQSAIAFARMVGREWRA